MRKHVSSIPVHLLCAVLYGLNADTGPLKKMRIMNRPYQRLFSRSKDTFNGQTMNNIKNGK